MAKLTLTPAQLEALCKWASTHGRTWKSSLRTAWMTGNYDGFEGACYLQQIRNTFGPSWLCNLRLD
jgi:hypothetical protein